MDQVTRDMLVHDLGAIIMDVTDSTDEAISMSVEITNHLKMAKEQMRARP